MHRDQGTDGGAVLETHRCGPDAALETADASPGPGTGVALTHRRAGSVVRRASRRCVRVVGEGAATAEVIEDRSGDDRHDLAGSSHRAAEAVGEEPLHDTSWGEHTSE